MFIEPKLNTDIVIKRKIFLSLATLYVVVTMDLYFYSVGAVGNVFPEDYYIYRVSLPLSVISTLMIPIFLLTRYRLGVYGGTIFFVIMIYTNWNLSAIEFRKLVSEGYDCSNVFLCHSNIILTIPITLCYIVLTVRSFANQISAKR